MFFIRRIVFILLCPALAVPLPAQGPAAGNDLEMLSSFADPARLWGAGVEAVIEEAYRMAFKTYIIGGKVMNLRMPFAENDERNKLSSQDWQFLGGGKANPGYLWGVIDGVLKTEDFSRYVAALGDGKEKVIVFDIPSKTWRPSRDLYDLARMKAGAYHGLPHRPMVLVSGKGIGEQDVYNYLYCAGWVGMDCSGFVWHVLSHVARTGGIDLNRRVGSALGTPRNMDTSLYMGTWFFNSSSREILPVSEEINQLRPGDILLFRSADGTIAHSAVIQSIDFTAGLIRYLQSTDEAPPTERGVHESFIHFDPAHPETPLRDPRLIWTQFRYPPFPGERASPFSDDGKRYRAYPELGGGRVVRLRVLEELVRTLNRER